MVREIKESDWKLFRRLHAVALERFCERAIREINHATSNCTEHYHKRFLEVFNLLEERNQELAWAFDDLRRKNAFFLLANIRENELLTDDEFSQFSAESREAVEVISRIRRM